MSDLVVIVYSTEARAEEMRQKLIGLQKEYLLEIGDAAIAVMREGGKVKLNQLMNTTRSARSRVRSQGLLDRRDLPDAALRWAPRRASGVLGRA